MFIKPVGGRGKKAPYETTTVRIPKELSGYLEVICDKYRQNLLQESSVEKNELDFSTKTRGEAIELKLRILKETRSVKTALEKMIEELYF